MTVAKQPQAVFPTVLESKGEELTMSGVWAAQVSLFSSGPKCCQGNAESPCFPESSDVVNREGLSQQDFPGKSAPPGGREGKASFSGLCLGSERSASCLSSPLRGFEVTLSSVISLGAWQEGSGRMRNMQGCGSLGV